MRPHTRAARRPPPGAHASWRETRVRAVSGPGNPRRDAGRALRADVPRSAHAEWSVNDRTHDPIAVLEEQARTRVDDLVPVRYARMAESPFAFFRGGAAIMAMDL